MIRPYFIRVIFEGSIMSKQAARVTASPAAPVKGNKAAAPVKAQVCLPDNQLADALQAAAGNKAAAIRAAAAAVGDALRIVVISGRKTKLEKAAALKLGKSARAEMIRAAFVAAVAEAAPFIRIDGATVTDTRKGEARRGTEEQAAAAEAAAVQAFNVNVARAMQAAADKRAAEAAAAAGEADAGEAEADAPAAEAARINPLDAALVTLAQADAGALHDALARCPAAAALLARVLPAVLESRAADAEAAPMVQAAAEAEAAEAAAARAEADAMKAEADAVQAARKESAARIAQAEAAASKPRKASKASKAKPAEAAPVALAA